MTKLWFKRKCYGWGWTPVTWQGWAVLVLYILFLTRAFGEGETFSSFSPGLIVTTVFLILICYATGEEPRWQWGKIDSGKSKIAPAEPSPAINFADFAKVDLRVGKVVSAEKVAGSDKLLRLFIDEGLENI